MHDILTTALGWAAQTGAQPAKPASPLSDPSVMLMILAIIGFLYFIVLRPGNRERRERESMMSALAKGDQVVTAGGIHGTIESVDKEKGIVSVTVAPKVAIKLSRSSIASVVSKKGKKDGE